MNEYEYINIIIFSALGSKSSRGLKTKLKKMLIKNYWDDQRSDASLSGKMP